MGWLCIIIPTIIVLTFQISSSLSAKSDQILSIGPILKQTCGNLIEIPKITASLNPSDNQNHVYMEEQQDKFEYLNSTGQDPVNVRQFRGEEGELLIRSQAQDIPLWAKALL